MKRNLNKNRILFVIMIYFWSAPFQFYSFIPFSSPIFHFLDELVIIFLIINVIFFILIFMNKNFHRQHQFFEIKGN